MAAILAPAQLLAQETIGGQFRRGYRVESAGQSQQRDRQGQGRAFVPVLEPAQTLGQSLNMKRLPLGGAAQAATADEIGMDLFGSLGERRAHPLQQPGGPAMDESGGAAETGEAVDGHEALPVAAMTLLPRPPQRMPHRHQPRFWRRIR